MEFQEPYQYVLSEPIPTLIRPLFLPPQILWCIGNQGKNLCPKMLLKAKRMNVRGVSVTEMSVWPRVEPTSL